MASVERRSAARVLSEHEPGQDQKNTPPTLVDGGKYQGRASNG
jgi:hypothetical protein